MVIGMQESKNCPVCGSDATWTNHDTCWKIHCSGFCGDFLITTITINYLKGDALRRLDAIDLLKEPTTLKTPLTKSLLNMHVQNIPCTSLKVTIRAISQC